MGKEAIHLGHGQLHLGISGVEEVSIFIQLKSNKILEHLSGFFL